MRFRPASMLCVLSLGLLSGAALADISGFSEKERSAEMQIRTMISNSPELQALNDVDPELAIIFAIRLRELRLESQGANVQNNKTLRENPEAILDLMKLIRLAAGGDDKK